MHHFPDAKMKKNILFFLPNLVVFHGFSSHGFSSVKNQPKINLPCDLEDSGALNRSPIHREIH